MSKPPLRPIAVRKYPGLVCGADLVGARDVDATFVSHNDIGLNYVERGEMRVQSGGGWRYTLRPGQMSAFWGAVPHKVESFAPRTLLHWIVLPLGIFLRWSLPNPFIRQLIAGRVFIETDPADAPLDLAFFRRWHGAIRSRDAENLRILFLEMEARLRRLGRKAAASTEAARGIVRRGSASQAERMLLMIAERFREELSAADVADAIGLHPGYASGLFRRHAGMGLTDYITQCRLSHAKALLATTDAPVLEVAMESGFGSISQFHAVFKRLAGCTPRAYRMALRSDS